MSQSINLRAVQWVDAQEGLSVTAKAVLMQFAIHADQCGYSWPGVDHIATKWGMDRKTVRRQIKTLLVRRMIYPTKKRRGTTGQVKVFRLPKITYGRGGKYTPFENEQRVPKESLKSPISGGKFPPNNIIINKEQKRISDQGAAKALGNSIPSTSHNSSSDSFFSESNQYQNVPARDHPKWSGFVAYCRSQRDKRGQPGQPTEKGFRTWLSKQTPYWRNRVAPKFAGELGYVHNGKFLTAEQAVQRGKENPELIIQFRPVIKRPDGTIHPSKNDT